LRRTFLDISPVPHAVVLVLSNLRRWNAAICAFGTEGWHRHEGPSLHNKTLVT
jgi:hypothetical protein